MNKIKKFYRDHLGVSILAALALIILISGTTLAAIILFKTFTSEQLHLQELCLNNSCIKSWITYNSSVFEILTVTGNLIAGLITFGGIIVAIASYQNSVKTSDLTNHLSHLTIFINYVHGEIEKRSRLTRSEIDTLKWYNNIYRHAEMGKFEVSEEYRASIQHIENQIKASNNFYINPSSETYSYKLHQTKIIETMSTIGIVMHRLPRLDFHEAEGQVLDLISTVNRSFCRNADLREFTDRSYK